MAGVTVGVKVRILPRGHIAGDVVNVGCHRAAFARNGVAVTEGVTGQVRKAKRLPACRAVHTLLYAACGGVVARVAPPVDVGYVFAHAPYPVRVLAPVCPSLNPEITPRIDANRILNALAGACRASPDTHHDPPEQEGQYPGCAPRVKTNRR